jgi:hypothetical protein
MRRFENCETLDAFGQLDNCDQQLWATSDYFWMLRSDVLDHAGGVWRSFSAGYTAYGNTAAGHDTLPPEPRHRAA